MTPKKKAESVDEAVSAETPEAVKEPKVQAPETCGHINRHHYNAAGRLEELACTLLPKHTGDHSATYKKNVGDPVHDEKGRVIKVEYHEEEATAVWNDAAGKPAADIQEGEIAQMTLFQKDLVMQLLAKNPTLTVDQAVAQAKQMPEWNSPGPS